jgi:hypothetical protein
MQVRRQKWKSRAAKHEAVTVLNTILMHREESNICNGLFRLPDDERRVGAAGL